MVITDLGQDGAPDVHVANDTTPNFLFRTVAGPDGVRFFEEGLASGVAYNEEGLPEAGMGNDFGDVDRDGLMDLVVTNFDFETNTLYRNLGGGLFLDATASFGLGSESLTELAFGCDLADFDNDGWLDLVVANGHILDNIASIQSNLTFAQPGQVFRNDRGRLRRRRQSEGDFARPRVGRGLASFDYDLDGDLDLALANNRGPAELLENRGGAEAGNAVGLLLIGAEGNREGIGARVRLAGGAVVQEEERRAGASYLSQHDPVLWFGLGAAVGAAGVGIRWPSGKEESLGHLPAGAVHVLKEGVGRVASMGIGAGAEPGGAAR